MVTRHCPAEMRRSNWYVSILFTSMAPLQQQHKQLGAMASAVQAAYAAPTQLHPSTTLTHPARLCLLRDCRSIDQFVVAKKLGGGYASTVHLAICKATGTQVAIKVYHRCKLSQLNNYQVHREIRIHSCLDHTNVLQLVSIKALAAG